MSIFITLLAFDNPVTINGSKIAILIASCVAASIGFIILRLTLTGIAADEVEDDE
jgi:NhaA family Na+:H+ antiporter